MAAIGQNYAFTLKFLKLFGSRVLTGENLDLSVLEEGERGEVVDAVGLGQPLVVDLDELDVELLCVVVDRLQVLQRVVASLAASRVPRKQSRGK